MPKFVDTDFRDSTIHVDDIPSAFQAYPHIADRVTLLWGTRECRDYLVKLSLNTDRSPRKNGYVGFSFTTAMKVLEVLEGHDRAYPMFAAEAAPLKHARYSELPRQW